MREVEEGGGDKMKGPEGERRGKRKDWTKRRGDRKNKDDEKGKKQERMRLKTEKGGDERRDTRK